MNSSDKLPRLPTDFINFWCGWGKSTRICPKFGQTIVLRPKFHNNQTVSMAMVFHWLRAPNACGYRHLNILSISKNLRFSPNLGGVTVSRFKISEISSTSEMYKFPDPRCKSLQIWALRVLCKGGKHLFASLLSSQAYYLSDFSLLACCLHDHCRSCPNSNYKTGNIFTVCIIWCPVKTTTFLNRFHQHSQLRSVQNT
jgi:hypothetical protein